MQQGRFCEPIVENFPSGIGSMVGITGVCPLGRSRSTLRMAHDSYQTHTKECINVETNSQKLVSLWNNRRKHSSKITAILDAVEQMTYSFTSFQVIHTRRLMNFTAHLCAQHSSSFLDNYVWLYPFSFLQNCLQSDCNNTV